MKRLAISLSVIGAAVGLLLIFRVPSTREMAKVNEEASIAVRSDAVSAPPKALADKPSASDGVESEGVLRRQIESLIGIIPFQSDELLNEIGASSVDSRVRVNALMERTFIMVVDTVAIHGAIAKSNERIRIEAAIPEGTRKLIRTQFYRELSAEIGEAAMQRLVSAGPIEELENSLLGFGENPIAITMEKRGIGADSNVRLTFGTMNGRTVGESYFVSQELALQTFKDAFPELDRRGFN